MFLPLKGSSLQLLCMLCIYAKCLNIIQNDSLAGSSWSFITYVSFVCVLRTIFISNTTGEKKKCGWKIWWCILVPEFESNQWLRRQFLPRSWCRLLAHQWIPSFLTDFKKVRYRGLGGACKLCVYQQCKSCSLKYSGPC